MPRWGKVGKQKIEDTGPLNKKRMETCDDEFVAAAKDFIKRQNKAGKPFFVWLNTTHMHCLTHTKKKSLGQAGRWQSPYHDTMIDHDKNVGQMLDLLDELGIADRHLRHVLDRQRPAQEHLARRRHDAVPQREEHQLGRRLPRAAAGALAGQDQGRIGRQRDRAAPRLAADLPRHGRRAGRGRQAEEGLQGDRPDLQEPHRRLQPAALPDRQGEGEPAQVLLLLQRRRRRARHALSTTGRSCSWSSACRARWTSGRSRSFGCGCRRSSTCAPIRTSSRTSRRTRYYDWMFHNAYFIYAAQAAAAKFAETFKEFPAVQKPNTFTIDDAMAKMSEPSS